MDSRRVSSCFKVFVKFPATCFMFLARSRICFSISAWENSASVLSMCGVYWYITPKSCSFSVETLFRYFFFRVMCKSSSDFFSDEVRRSQLSSKDFSKLAKASLGFSFESSRLANLNKLTTFILSEIFPLFISIYRPNPFLYFWGERLGYNEFFVEVNFLLVVKMGTKMNTHKGFLVTRVF